jgi:competence protein ComEC
LTFQKVPFVYITSFFLLGIVFIDNTVYGSENALISLFMALSIYILLSKVKNEFLKKIRVGLLFLAILFTGGSLISFNRTESKSITKGTSVLLSVDEIASEDKDWRKAICTVNSLVTKDSVVNHVEKILLFFNSSQVQVGDVLLVQANLDSIKNKNNPGEFNVKAYWNNKDVYQIGFVGESDFKLIKTVDYPWWMNWSSRVRNHLTEKLKSTLNGEALGVAVALLLGDKQLLTNEVRSSFSNAGAMHVLAVSGLHVGIVLYILMFVLGKFTRFISKRNAVLISIAIIWIYAAITGFSPSVLRASFMFSVLAIAQITGRNKNSINVLFFSAFVLLLFQPLWVYDIGFQLSYLAMTGIFVLYPLVSKLIYFKNKWLTKIWQGTAVGLSAQLFTVPLTLFYFHQFPNYFILTNIGMMVFAGAVLGLGLLFFVVSWSTFLAFIAGNLLKIGLIGMLFFVQWIDGIPFSVATGFQLSFVLLCLIYTLLILFIFATSTKLKVSVLVSFGMIFLMVHFQRYQNLRESEMIVFNSDDFTVAIKSKDQILCFYTAKKERIKKVKSMLKDYSLVRPGNITFVFLEDGLTKATLHKDKYEIYTDKYGVNISSAKVKLYVRTNYSGNYFELDNSCDMAYLSKNKDRYNLAQGAKIIPLN